MSIFVFYKISTSTIQFYKILTSLSTVFIKVHVRFYNFKSGRVALRFFTHMEPYVCDTQI